MRRRQFLIGTLALLRPSTLSAHDAESDQSSLLYVTRAFKQGSSYLIDLTYSFGGSRSILSDVAGLIEPSGSLSFITSRPVIEFRDGGSRKLLRTVSINQVIAELSKRLNDTTPTLSVDYASSLYAAGQDAAAAAVAQRAVNEWDEFPTDDNRVALRTVQAQSLLNLGRYGEARYVVDSISPWQVASTSARIAQSDLYLSLGQVKPARTILLTATTDDITQQADIEARRHTLSNLGWVKFSQSALANLEPATDDIECADAELFDPVHAQTTGHVPIFVSIITSVSKFLFNGHALWMEAADGWNYYRTCYRRFKAYESGVNGRIAFRVRHPSVSGHISSMPFEFQFAASQLSAGGDGWQKATAPAVVDKARQIADDMRQSVVEAIG